MEITIPTDNDGFVLLQCERCGEYFKITPTEIENDTNLFIYCPMCGMTSDTYVTEDVIELAKIMVKNHIEKEIYNSLKPLERTNRKSILKFKIGPKPVEDYETPITSGIDVLELKTFRCCNKQAKVHPLIKMSGSYCPFCGESDYGH